MFTWCDHRANNEFGVVISYGSASQAQQWGKPTGLGLVLKKLDSENGLMGQAVCLERGSQAAQLRGGEEEETRKGGFHVWASAVGN